MSGLVLTQLNTTIEIDIGSGYVDFPCVTAFETGTSSTNFVDTTCFSTATAEPEYAAARKTVSAGSAAYNADSSNSVHQWLLANQASGETVPIKTTITYPSGFEYERVQNYLVGSVSEAMTLDQIFTHTVELQASGAVTRTYTTP